MPQELELKFNKKSPFNSMANLHSLVQKGRGEAGILWILAGVSDMLESKQFSTNTFNIRFFTGQGMGGKGLCDLLYFKKTLMDFFVSTFLDSFAKMSSEAKASMREVLSSYSMYRQKLAPFDGELNEEWMSGWANSEKEMLQFG